jgi:hypothetical protein
MTTEFQIYNFSSKLLIDMFIIKSVVNEVYYIFWQNSWEPFVESISFKSLGLGIKYLVGKHNTILCVEG